MSEGEGKKCPECGDEMEKGYLHTAGYSVWWNKRKPGLFQGGGERVLGPSLSFATKPAYRCPRCKVIILYYGKGEISHE